VSHPTSDTYTSNVILLCGSLRYPPVSKYTFRKPTCLQRVWNGLLTKEKGISVLEVDE